MRYKVTLTTMDGKVLETWTVCLARQADEDVHNISRDLSAMSIIQDMRHEITMADKRAGVRP